MNSESMRSSLPKNWPHGVKTAVLHVISLAHAAMVHARGILVSSPEARTRWRMLHHVGKNETANTVGDISQIQRT